MGRKKETLQTGFTGERYIAVRLCEMFCIIDTLPDDPEYRRLADYGCVIYFQKIIKALPASYETSKIMTTEAKRLEEEWKSDPNRERKLKERDWCNRVIRRRWNERQSIASSGAKPRRWSGAADRPKRKYVKKKKPEG